MAENPTQQNSKEQTEEQVIYLNDCEIAQSSHVVLNNVNLSLRKGEFAYLIGKTGSGKSSLLKLLYGDLPLTNGEGRVVGSDLRKLKVSNIPDLRRHLGIVFQDFQLLQDRTVEKNLIFVLRATSWKDKSAMNERIEEVLTSVNMLEKRNSMPHELSGGEQQRVAIARALLNHPELILADEPTGNLDPATSREIMNLLKDVSKVNNCAVFMATHDYDIIRNFPAKTLVCQDGNVEIAGNEVMTLF